MGTSNFDQLIEMLNFNYAIALLMEYAAFIKLRITQPEVERPYRIPLNTFGCILLFTPTCVVTILVMALATYSTYIFVICTNIIGILVFWAKTRSDRARAVEEAVNGAKVVDAANATMATIPE
jgi:amino acid transporter